MKLPRYPTQADWEEIVALGPGTRMFRGMKAMFYNGEKLWEGDDDVDGHPLVHNEEERQLWQVIIVLPGVEIIPEWTFFECKDVKTVIMADTVRRIEWSAFDGCYSLVFVRLSRNLEYIGGWAFFCCKSLTSIFIPPSCREICNEAFWGCRKLIILSIHQHVQLGYKVFGNTALIKKSPFELDKYGENERDNEEAVIEWVKSINNGEVYAFHRLCCSHDPDMEEVYQHVKNNVLATMKHPNSIGITPSEYLAANPYSEFEEGKIIQRFVLEMMGEVV